MGFLKFTIHKVFFVFLFSSMALAASAQGQLVKGKVTDAATNDPIPGVVVKVKGTSNAMATDVNGAFQLGNVAQGAVLQISSIGYDTREITADLAKDMEVKLSSAIGDLNEVVVIGYGTQKKSDVTGAISSVSTETLVKTAKVNPVGALQGVVAGVNITRSTNKPGGGFSVDIRGVHSVTGTNAPLVVVDGVPGADLSKINPADIEKIDILKDASATAIYGSRGTNGVIMVTTKRGTTGKPRITYSSYVGFRQYTNKPDMMSGDEYVQLAREASRATNNNVYRTDAQVFGDPSELKSVQDHNYYDWVDAVSNPVPQTSHTLSASGGTDDVKYTLSGGYYYEGGMLKPQSYTRYNLRAALDITANSYLGFGGSLYFTHDIQETGNTDLLQDAYRMRPTQFPNSLVDGAEFFKYSSNGLFNPLVTQRNEFNNIKGSNILGNAYVKVTPIKGLELRSTFSPYMVNTQTGQYRGVYTKALQGTAAGATSSLRKQTNTNWVLDNIANYKWTKGIHNLDVTAVYSLQQNQQEVLNAASKDLSFNSLWYNLNGGAMTAFGSNYIQTNLQSYLGRVNYSLMNKYLLTVSARYDGSSKLAAGNKWALFPSAAVAWRLSEESFIKDLSWINDLKLRVSYGQTGNDTVDPYQSVQSISGSQYYSFGTDVIGNLPNNLPNPSLTWERTSEYNLGLDFGLFKGRISGSLEYYNRLSKDLIMPRSIPVTLGYASIIDNVGSARNKGVELTLNTVNVQSENFKWSSSITFAYNKNELVDLGFKEDLGKYSPQLAGIMGDYNNRWFIGQPIRSNWDLMTIGVWQLGEEAEAAKYGQKPGQFKVKDMDGDGVINVDKDRQLDGSRTPNWNGGFTNTFQYKNFDFAAHAYFRTGARDRNAYYVSYALENNNLNFNNLRKDYWTPENPSNTMGQPSNMGPYRDINNTSSIGNLTSVSHVVQNTDFLKIAYLTLGYTFNKSFTDKLKISNVRVYATVQNPFTFSKYSGFDPEQPNVAVASSDLMTRNTLFGLDFSF